jgi:hypothetical protein
MRVDRAERMSAIVARAELRELRRTTPRSVDVDSLAPDADHRSMGFKATALRHVPATITLTIELSPLPNVWCTDPAALSVGLQSGKSDIVRGERTADRVRWTIEVPVRASKAGALDFGGPLVHGKPGERFLYVSWGTTEKTDHDMFRRLKLYLGPLTRAGWSQSGITWNMLRSGTPLQIIITGRAPDGTPHCGTAPAYWKP